MRNSSICDMLQAFDNERAKHMFETRIRIDSRLDRTLLSNVLPARLSGI